MQIELLKNGRMTTGGNSILKMMQNNSIPSLDLIVRESVQNSLDAALKDSKDVYVFIKNDSFNIESLSKEFPDIQKSIIKRFGTGKANFLSVRDTHTVGLTGNLDGKFDKNKKDQNLAKLVFNIMKNQQAEGAGGSWGIGKTVYYRVGIGLTIYYSRIKNEDNTYEERLVAVLVEDEDKDGLLSSFSNNLGMAFFGDKVSEEGIQAITNPEIIHNFLSIFGLAPFIGESTGTEIIIPFIDEEELLKNNAFENQNFWWCKSIEEYLIVSLLRWYFPRMSKKYNYGARLIAFVNNKYIDIDKPDLILFKKYQELYDACFEDECADWIKKQTIVRTKNVEDSEVGKFVYGLVTKEELLMNAPYTLPNPFQYVLLNENNDTKYPLIGFTRKPGMITNYNFKDFSSVKLKKEDSYIIGLFVLNSNNTLVFGENKKINLDEYIRKSEKSDHTSWEDYSIEKGRNKIKIVGHIINDIINTLSNEYNEQTEITGESSVYLDLSRKFSKLLMPPEGYGNKGSTPPHKRKRDGGGVVTKNDIAKVSFLSRNFVENNIHLSYNIKFKKHNCKIIFTHHVVTVNGEVSMRDYEQHYGDCPFEINKAAINYQIYKKYEMKVIDLSKGIETNSINITPIKSINKDRCLGLDISFDNNNIDEINLNISLSTNDRLIKIKPNFDIKEVKNE